MRKGDLDSIGGTASDSKLIKDAMKTLRAAGMFVSKTRPKKEKAAKSPPRKKGASGRLLGRV